MIELNDRHRYELRAMGEGLYMLERIRRLMRAFGISKHEAASILVRWIREEDTPRTSRAKRPMRRQSRNAYPPGNANSTKVRQANDSE